MPTVKMLDFGISFSGDARMAKPRKIAWPVKAYRVTLPDSTFGNQSGLNPFEELVMTFLEIEGPVSEERLSEETCIPEDFVKGVLLRLQDKAFIDNRNAIIESAKRDNGQKFKSAMIFQELVEGKVLPFVYYNQQPMTKREETGQYCWKMAKGEERLFPEVTPDDVLKAIKTQRRHDKAYGESSAIPAVSLIRVSPSHEYYHLDCPIGVRPSDGEFRIGNPFGSGYSLVLEGVFLRKLDEDGYLEGWLNSWRENLKQSHENEPDDCLLQPYESKRCKSLYPRLIPNLKPNKYGIRSIEKIYSSIEWALFYVNERVDSRHAIDVLQLTNPAETPLLLEDAAKAIGLEVPKRGFLRVQPYSIENYLEEVPEMPTALAICMLMAKNDEAHPLRSFAETNPDAVIRLYQIKKERDIKAHGKGKGARGGTESRNDLFMRELVHALLPEVSFSVDQASQAAKADSYADARFEARSNLLSQFGYASFNTKLSSLTQDRLVDAECFWMGFSEGEDALPFVGDLYAALQSEFSRRVEPAGIRSTTDKDLADLMSTRARELGIYPLPDALSTVRPNNIRKALQGLDETTLGALIVAYILATDAETIEMILDRSKTFFRDASEIIVARGHLNEARAFSKEEVDQLREIAYRTITALVEA